jgi:hypothetical protein
LRAAKVLRATTDERVELFKRIKKLHASDPKSSTATCRVSVWPLTADANALLRRSDHRLARLRRLRRRAT